MKKNLAGPLAAPAVEVCTTGGGGEPSWGSRAMRAGDGGVAVGPMRRTDLSSVRGREELCLDPHSQARKDVMREEFVLNGALVRGADFLANWIENHDDEAIATTILDCCSRTGWGGDSYEVIRSVARECQTSSLHITPSTPKPRTSFPSRGLVSDLASLPPPVP